MFDLLNVATLKARVEARYKFIHSAIYSKYKLEINNQLGLDGELAILAKKGSASAAYELYQTSVDEVNLYKWLLIAANNGSANAAYEVAMFCYSRERGAKLLTLAECKIRNEEKMFYWLKRALQNQHGGAYWVRGRVAAELSKLYLKGFEQHPADAKEAYLWALIAINNDGGGYF